MNNTSNLLFKLIMPRKQVNLNKLNESTQCQIHESTQCQVHESIFHEKYKQSLKSSSTSISSQMHPTYEKGPKKQYHPYHDKH